MADGIEGAAVTVWGRANSVNVQKVLWCGAELGVAIDRIDAGMQFGQTDTPAYRRMNPNGRVPTLVDGDQVVWESNTVMRYLVMRRAEIAGGAGLSLYPAGAAARSLVDRWLDWTLSTLQPVERDLFWGLVRMPEAQRDPERIAASARATCAAWAIVDAHLAGRDRFMAGEEFTLADIALGAYARRWFGVAVPDRPALDGLAAWYARVSERPGFARHVAQPLT